MELRVCVCVCACVHTYKHLYSSGACIYIHHLLTHGQAVSRADGRPMHKEQLVQAAQTHELHQDVLVAAVICRPPGQTYSRIVHTACSVKQASYIIPVVLCPWSLPT